MKRSLLLYFLISVCIISKTSAQLAGSSVFLQGQYVEIGISECGVHGTAEEPPTGPYSEYHGIEINGLGFIADHEKDGWDISTGADEPVFCGDYFTPGSPEEGWAIQYGDSIYENHYVGCAGYGETVGTSDISGAITEYIELPEVKSAVWEGNLAEGSLDINIKQTTILPDTALFFLIQIEITNNSTTSDITDLYYTYNVDPDQDLDWCGTFNTTNEVVNNFPDDDTAQVTAIGLECGCFFSLSSLDERARVSYGNFYLYPATPAQAWGGDTIAGYYNSGVHNCDCAVQLSFKLDILAGTTETIYYARAFAPPAVDQALSYIEDVLQAPFQIYADDANITGDGTTQICSGASVELSIESDDEYTWTWEPATYLSATTGTSVVSTPEESITYTITGTPVTGDPVSSAITINVIPPIEILTISSPSLSDEPTGSASAIIVGGGAGDFTYLWNTGEITPTVTNVLPGDYTVTVTDAAGCSATATVTVAVSESVYDLQNSNAFTIFPNPASDGFTLTPSSSISKNYSLEITSVNGQIISCLNFENNKPQHMNTKNLSEGFYVLKLITNNRIYMKSLLVQK